MRFRALRQRRPCASTASRPMPTSCSSLNRFSRAKTWITLRTLSAKAISVQNRPRLRRSTISKPCVGFRKPSRWGTASRRSSSSKCILDACTTSPPAKRGCVSARAISTAIRPTLGNHSLLPAPTRCCRISKTCANSSTRRAFRRLPKRATCISSSKASSRSSARWIALAARCATRSFVRETSRAVPFRPSRCCLRSIRATTRKVCCRMRRRRPSKATRCRSRSITGLIFARRASLPHGRSRMTISQFSGS